MVDQGRELGWDERVDQPDEGGFTMLPDGIYPFKVLSFERSRHEGSEKLPACNSAIVSIEFDGGPQLGTTSVKHTLFLHTKTTGLLSQFFRGIGLRKHGDPLVLNWGAISGRQGYAKLGKRTYDGREFQDIKNFLYPEDWPAQASSQPAQPAQPVQPAQSITPGEDAPF